MQRWESDGFPPEDEKRRRQQERLGKAGRIGAVVLLSAIAFLSIRMFLFSGTSQEFSIDRGEKEQVVADTSTDPAPASSTKQQTPSTVTVFVSGAVANPGVYDLAEGLRVIDAVKAAGNMVDDAAVDSVNLARKVQDGEHIYIPHQDENAASVPDQAASGEGSGLLNINTADAQALESLPGIGPATAGKIIEERESNGMFASVDDLARVSGIGDKKLEALRSYICV